MFRNSLGKNKLVGRFEMFG